MKNRYCKTMTQIACVMMIILALCAGTASAEEGSNSYLGKPFPDFTITDTDGNTFALSEALKSHEAVLINFWATWCEPCRREFPFLNEACEKYRDRVAFIALSTEPKDTPEKIAEYRRENGLSIPMGRDENQKLYESVDWSGLPVTVVVDRFGNAAFCHDGVFKDPAEVGRVLDSFLGENYTETALLKEVPRDASTRTFPVYAARAIYPESGNYRKICFHLTDLAEPITAYIVPEDSVRLRIEIAADDDIVHIYFGEGEVFTTVDKLLDTELNAYVYELKIPDVTAEIPYVDTALFDETKSDRNDQYTMILFRDETCISSVVDYLKTWQCGEVSWEFADADKAENGPQAYIMHVVDQDNNPVEEVAVNFCTDTACVPKESDENGTITFTGDRNVYHVQIIDVPDGYSYDEGYEMYTTREYGEWILRIRKD